MFHGLCRIFTWATVTACLTATLTTATSAAVTILYISTTGSNTNPCTLAQPCRSLQKAVNTAPDGGEVHVLDSGFYGNNANIRKSITISGNGHTVTLGTPIIINEATAVVSLRALVLDGQGSTQRGVNIAAAAVVHIERCVVRNFTENGINIFNASAKLFVLDSVSRDNGGSGLRASGTGVKLTVDNSRFENNANTGIVMGFLEATINRTVSSGNVFSGILASHARVNVTSTTSAQNLFGFAVNNGGNMVVESSVARGNLDAGLSVSNTGKATVSNSVFTYNDTGIWVDGTATVLTLGNNVVTDNNTNTFGALTPLGPT